MSVRVVSFPRVPDGRPWYPTPDESSPEPIPGRRSRHVPVGIALLAASLPMFMATLDNLVMTTALPVIAVDLRPTVEELQWFVNAYTLAFATFMLPAATLGDRIGRRRRFLTGLLVFTAASIRRRWRPRRAR